ncbi:PUA-like domain-containing protein [Kalaharituber pfeilii]|nr:PUA-like domain-containing protein [Kalaharituber pfeilii]
MGNGPYVLPQLQESMTELQRTTASLEGMDMKDQGIGNLASMTTGTLTAHIAPSTLTITTSTELDPTRDARNIVRLLQCPVCSRPLKRPVSLPCGNAICSTCLPQFHERQNISYPNTTDRKFGFTCCFTRCGLEHVIGDFSVDFTLKRVLDIVETELQRFMPFAENTSVILEEVPCEDESDIEDEGKVPGKTAVLRGGRLAATYTYAERGNLPYDMDLNYHSASGEDLSHLDKAILNHLRDKVQPELQCLVCYSLYLDPVTTACGHTFCRKCLERVLDHSLTCPMCRKVQHISTAILQFQGSNQVLTDLLGSLYPDESAQRMAQGALEDKAGAIDMELPTPLFVCTLSFPKMPTFLHIFEPRYRLMVRRAWQGDKRFGMVLPNRHHEPQSGLGNNCTFLQFGTLLEIKSYRLLPDGRSWIETVGISRFKVKRWGYRDDYIVSAIEPVDDLSYAEEESSEAMEITNTQDCPRYQYLNSLTTQQLFQLAQQFIQRMELQSAQLQHQRVINIYGFPPEDPAIFPYWIASVLPINETEKYRLLSCNSVRGRLKIAAGWIKKIEEQQLFSANSCAIA